ncbi:MAG: hypothetical protein AB7O95_29020 [Geminicoccaceae bacterium]
MVRDFALRLRLAAAVLGCETRKELAAAFRRVNPHTSFDVVRADKWLSGKASPRTADVYRDWGKLLALDGPHDWLMGCSIDDLVDALAGRHGMTPDAILERARGFPRGALSRDPPQRSGGGPSFIEGAYACYGFAFTPYYPGRLLRASLVIGPGSGRQTATYILNVASAPAKFFGPVFVTGRGMHIELHQVPEGDTRVYMVLFAPSPPASFLAGVLCGSATLGPDSEPSMTRIAIVRLPGPSAAFNRLGVLIEPGTSIAGDLEAAGLRLLDGREVDRRLMEFLPARAHHGIEQVTIAEYRSLVALFDQEHFARATAREPAERRVQIRSVG